MLTLKLNLTGILTEKNPQELLELRQHVTAKHQTYVQSEEVGAESNLEVSMHDEVGVREPDILVVVDGVQEVVVRLVGVAQPRVVPLLLQKELHFVFLEFIK